MSTDDTDALSTQLLQAKRRDVRRATIVMVALVVILVAGSTAWIADLTRSRDTWRTESQAGWSAHAELSEKYGDLYDEFVRETGELPFAEAPDKATDASDAHSDSEDDSAASSEAGVQGPPGPPGPVGPVGIQGEPGLRGLPGRDGETVIGPPGETGSQGPQGPAGESIKGETGATGEKGDTGLQGPAGQDGAVGPAGPKGDPGANGVDGKDGADGRGIAGLVCDEDGVWQVTYTDGETEEAGACRAPTPVTDPAA